MIKKVYNSKNAQKNPIYLEITLSVISLFFLLLDSKYANVISVILSIISIILYIYKHKNNSLIIEDNKNNLYIITAYSRLTNLFVFILVCIIGIIIGIPQLILIIITSFKQESLLMWLLIWFAFQCWNVNNYLAFIFQIVAWFLLLDNCLKNNYKSRITNDKTKLEKIINKKRHKKIEEVIFINQDDEGIECYCKIANKKKRFFIPNECNDIDELQQKLQNLRIN